jgi:4'-phosphopantetheinyl transferase
MQRSDVSEQLPSRLSILGQAPRFMHNDHNLSTPWLKLWFSQIGESTVDAEQSLLDWLSTSERARLARIRHDDKRREYLLSRLLMRHALTECFQPATAEWQFNEQIGAMPAIEELPTGVHSSLSHSGGYVCFGLANCALGVDIEIVRPRRDLLAGAKIFMAQDELSTLGNNAATAMDYFYRCWCAKEACYKSLAPRTQETTAFNTIRYMDLRSGSANRHLIEGGSDEFHFAAAMAQRPTEIRQWAYLATVAVSIKDSA